MICASSMMSHGVDIDRFNVITMLGVPLATAEFIQTTARIGRRLPGLVLVLHRMGVERDASVFRTFDVYVRQGDRFIDPVAITRKSRRVLHHTFPGVFLARLLGVHEAKRVRSGGKQITTVTELRKYVQDQWNNGGRGVHGTLSGFGHRCECDGRSNGGGAEAAFIGLHLREINYPATKARMLGEVTP